MHKSAHIFPAFVIKYLGKEIDYLNHHNINYSSLFKEIENSCQIKLSDFDIKENNYLDHELKTQLITYIISCGISDILKKKGQIPEIVSGLSMGIYAALYHIESIEFKDGARLIKEIYQVLKNIIFNEYRMLSVIGFSKDELNQIIKNSSYEIVIKNGDFSFVIAGEKDKSEILINELTEKGAIHILTFNASIPYHSSFISDASGKIHSLLENYKLMNARFNYLSMNNQKIISSGVELKKEVYNNLFSKLDFYKTLVKMDNNGIITCFECGPGNSLTKSSKFIDSSLNFISLKKFSKYF